MGIHFSSKLIDDFFERNPAVPLALRRHELWLRHPEWSACCHCLANAGAFVAISTQGKGPEVDFLLVKPGEPGFKSQQMTAHSFFFCCVISAISAVFFPK